VRLLNGWTVRTATELDPTIRVWHEALCEYQIPPRHFNELYKRALNVRQAKLQIGARDVPNIDAALLISQWTGPHGLEADLRKREVESGRLLTTTAPSQCLRCYGTGMETIYDKETGQKLGVRPGCNHEYIDESDPSTAGLEDAMHAVRYNVQEETAIGICTRVRAELQYLVNTAPTDEQWRTAWNAYATWVRAERYCKNNPD
jgi:hypothetical protein